MQNCFKFDYDCKASLDFCHANPQIQTAVRMIYEYKCQDCGQINEFWMKISDPSPTECPSCKGHTLERIISKTSFALKGTGWYTSDYKRAASSTTSTTPSSSTSPAADCCAGGSCASSGTSSTGSSATNSSKGDAS